MREKIAIPVLALVLSIFTIVNLVLVNSYKEVEQKLEQIRELEEKYGKEETSTPIREDALDEWLTLQMAIVMTESQFNPDAVGKDGDWGIFQITDIYSRELNRIQKKVHYSHEDAFDIEKAVAMFGTMQEYYNPEKDIDKAFKYHNKAEWYKKRVVENITFIQQMEEVRKVIKKSQKRTYL